MIDGLIFQDGVEINLLSAQRTKDITFCIIEFDNTMYHITHSIYGLDIYYKYDKDLMEVTETHGYESITDSDLEVLKGKILSQLKVKLTGENNE